MLPPVKIFKGFWKPSDCLYNSNWLFIFGDNDVKRGLGGQAVIRRCRNAMGIPTKKYPNYNPDSYYTDDEFTENCQKIDAALDRIIETVETTQPKYEYIVLPEDGFGTGLARLKTHAPRTLEYIDREVLRRLGRPTNLA